MEVKIFKKDGNIQIYRQGVIAKKSYVGRMLDIGKIDEVIGLLRKYDYPLTIMEEENGA